MTLRIGILGSTRGTHLTTIYNAIVSQNIPASIEVVISNKSDALILSRAKNANLKAVFVNSKNLPRHEYDELISKELKDNKIDLVLLVGYMRILSNSFVQQWQSKILNVHPSLLPKFGNLMDLEVHSQVLASGDVETGCTVHYVTEAVDEGPVLIQKKCPVLPGDTPETLKARVQLLEGDALVEAIRRFIV